METLLHLIVLILRRSLIHFMYGSSTLTPAIVTTQIRVIPVSAGRSLIWNQKTNNMKQFDINKVPALPDDMDQECVDLCNTLNTLPGVSTFESCCGHLKYKYSIWFFCDSIDSLSRLGKVTERNYSDGNWEVVVDSTDTHPYGVFWLRSKEPFTSSDDMNESMTKLIENINYWFDDKFDDYFKNNNYEFFASNSR